jgi:hypothetical protein
MDPELKKLLDEQGATFAAFKTANDEMQAGAALSKGRAGAWHGRGASWSCVRPQAAYPRKSLDGPR